MQVDRLLERTRRGLEPSRVGERVAKVGEQVSEVLPVLGFGGRGRRCLPDDLHGRAGGGEPGAGVAVYPSGVGQRVQGPGEDHRVGLVAIRGAGEGRHGSARFRLGEVGGEPGEFDVSHTPTLRRRSDASSVPCDNVEQPQWSETRRQLSDVAPRARQQVTPDLV